MVGAWPEQEQEWEKAGLQLQINELVLERPSLHWVDARATTCGSESMSGPGAGENAS